MRIPNYDTKRIDSNFKRLLSYMPSNTFRMLMCGPTGCGKTNTLMHMIYNVRYYDKIYLYSKNLDQPKYQGLLQTFAPISRECGYEVVGASNDQILPLEELDDKSQKVVTFDDFVCEKKSKATV